MGPAWALLWLTADPASDTELRALARAHPEAAAAAHVSRSYRAPLALVAWHTAPVGVDLEYVEIGGNGFAESICTPGELVLFEGRLDDDAFVASLWAGKEALAKALGDAIAYDPRRLDSPATWRRGIAGRWRAREFIPAPNHVAWLVWVEPATSSEREPPVTRR
jgi:phosphopantetheinyl transferase